MLAGVQEQVCFLCRLKNESQNVSVTEVLVSKWSYHMLPGKLGSLLGFFILLIKFQLWTQMEAWGQFIGILEKNPRTGCGTSAARRRRLEKISWSRSHSQDTGSHTIGRAALERVRKPVCQLEGLKAFVDAIQHQKKKDRDERGIVMPCWVLKGGLNQRNFMAVHRDCTRDKEFWEGNVHCLKMTLLPRGGPWASPSTLPIWIDP